MYLVIEMLDIAQKQIAQGPNSLDDIKLCITGGIDCRVNTFIPALGKQCTKYVGLGERFAAGNRHPAAG